MPVTTSLSRNDLYIVYHNLPFVHNAYQFHHNKLYYVHNELQFDHNDLWRVLNERVAFCTQQLTFVHNDLKFENNKLKTLNIRQTRRSIRYTSYVPWAIRLANLVFMNMHEAGETILLPMKSHVTIKYSSITMTYWDFLTSNRNQRTCWMVNQT